MALLFMDGFEHYATGDKTEKWNLGANYDITNARARTGAQCCILSDAKVSLPLASGSTVIAGFGYYTTALSDGLILCGVGNVLGGQCLVFTTATGALQVYRSGGNASWGFAAQLLGSTAVGVVRVNAWMYIEVKAVIDNSVGAVTLKVNGVTVLTLTNQDTQATADATWTIFGIGGAGGMHMDDLYVCDGSGATNNDFLGECRVVTLLPQTDAVAAGSNADFTCSTGADHGALVDDAAPDDDTTYLSSSTLNHVDSWEYPALGYTGDIKGVQMSLSAKKADSGARAIAAVARPAATNRVHATNHYIGTSYAYWLSLWELNPEDSAAWEVADVDGAEFGVKVTV